MALVVLCPVHQMWTVETRCDGVVHIMLDHKRDCNTATKAHENPTKTKTHFVFLSNLINFNLVYWNTNPFNSAQFNLPELTLIKLYLT